MKRRGLQEGGRERASLSSCRLFPVTFDGRLVTRLNLRCIEYIALDDTYLHRATDYRDATDSLRGGEKEVERDLTFNARCAPLPTEFRSRNFEFAHNDTKSDTREKSVAARYIAISGPTYRGDERRDGKNGKPAESATKIDFISPRQRATVSRDF